MILKIIVVISISLVAWYLLREMLLTLDHYIRKNGMAKKISNNKSFKFSTDPVFKR